MKNLYFLIAFIPSFLSAQFSDNMESYTENQPISVGHWTDWGCGGGSGCAIMSSSVHAQGGILSGYIPPDFTTDAVLDLGNKIFGEWGLSFWAYIPSGKEAYFNLQGTVPIVAGEWIVGNFYFNKDNVNPGIGIVDDTALGQVNFSFPHDQWFRIVMNWDITSGIGFATWQFNVSGIDVIPPGTPFTDSVGSTPVHLGGIDIFSISTNNQLWLDTFEYEPNFISIIPDTEDPVAICQNITVQIDNNGAAIINGIDIDGGSTDNVGIISYTAVPDSFNCNDLGANTVTLIVEDFAGNTDTCTAIVTLEDNINPIVNGQNTVGNLNGTGSVTIPVNSVDNGSSDNCSIDTLTLTPDTFTTVGTYNAVLEGTDTSGNSDSDTVIITIVDDNEPPVAICQNITVQLDTNGIALITGNDIDGGSTDDVEIISYTAVPDNFDCSNLGVNNVTLIVEDVVGNTDTCTAIVTIEDSINPIVIGQNATGDLNGLGTVTIPIEDVDNGSNDNCSIDTLTLTPDTFTDVGIYTAVLEGTDIAGNSDSVNVTITIIEGSPVIVEIPDANFKNALVSTLCVDNDGDGIAERDVDINDDGEIQESEAESVFRLYVPNNDIISLEGITGFTNLLVLRCEENEILILDVSQNPDLEVLDCYSNNLLGLDISNGNNTNMTRMFAYDNFSLACIQVDDENYANSLPNCQGSEGWCISTTTSYSESCVWGVDDEILSSVSIYPNPVEDILTITITSNIELLSIVVYDIQGRHLLKVQENFNRIDVSSLDNGVFFLNIETDRGVVSKKIIKE